MILPFTRPEPNAEARALLAHILDHGDVLGTDAHGRTIFTLALDDWMLDRLATFDAASTDDEPDDDAELDGPPAS